MFEPMMEYLRTLAADHVTTGDHHTREAAANFLAAYDLWKLEDQSPKDGGEAVGYDFTVEDI